jgi:hypothetical protein
MGLAADCARTRAETAPAAARLDREAAYPRGQSDTKPPLIKPSAERI